MPAAPDKPVLLTGASGNLGRVLARELTALGWTLRLTDLAPFPDPLPERASFTRMDLADGVGLLRLAPWARRFTVGVYVARFILGNLFVAWELYSPEFMGSITRVFGAMPSFFRPMVLIASIVLGLGFYVLMTILLYRPVVTHAFREKNA